MCVYKARKTEMATQIFPTQNRYNAMITHTK